MKGNFKTRLFSVVMSLVFMFVFTAPVNAAVNTDGQSKENGNVLSFEKIDRPSEASDQHRAAADAEEQPEYGDEDIVRVSIVLGKKSTLEAGFSTKGIAANNEAANYRKGLETEQSKVTKSIEQKLNEKLDVVWNLTLAANIISANVPYGKIEEIKNISGVKDVEIETQYEPCVVNKEEATDPNMATSQQQIGSALAWAAGYTGAGMRIAVIDTGIDTDHQSFSAAGYNYSLAYNAGLKGQSVEDYINSLDLLDADEISSKLSQMNIAGTDAGKLYVNSKIPFGYNYVDKDYEITHDTDTEGEHGSHVEGIAAANAWIPNEDGTFSNALQTVKAQGVAPDAQIITMKVFGKGGGAYDSDYMAAIEDAIVLGCDSVNLSLGSGSPGFTNAGEYQDIMDNLANSDTIVSMSAGNAYSWPSYANNDTGYLYGDDVSFQTNGSPGSFRNSFNVASVNNIGQTGNYIQVGDKMVFYTETSYSNKPMSTLSGDQEYIYIDGVGTDDDFKAIGDDLQGKIAVCSRGSTSFYQKAEAAVKYGAIGTIIYNNQSGTISMDLSSYSKTQPVVSITKVDGAVLKANAEAVKDDAGKVLYYKGKMTLSDKIGSSMLEDTSDVMSNFSSWGVPGSLELKPEITAPGGNIYSVNGAIEGGKAYENMSGTSMASPQVVGMSAVAIQYIEENKLDEKTGLSARTLAQSLLMSTARPMRDKESDGNYYPVLQQGSGLANINSAVSADSYIMMDESATVSAKDGKVKAELGDDPDRTGNYSYSFTLNNITDEARAYTLASDFFTQDIFGYSGNTYLDTWTALLGADVSYTVDGETFRPESRITDCDLNGDGRTDAKDAQIILEYAAGNIGEIDSKADVDGDGDIDTYDAYLILKGMETGIFSVEAGKSAHITVNISLPEEVKSELNENYVNGAYVEGYTYVNSVVTDEGVVSPSHSIPVLGFYGNWTDASMYDKQTYTGYLYGDTTAPYTGEVKTNNLTITYPGSDSSYYSIGNPYVIEDTYPAGREAISSGTTMNQYYITLIRNAANMVYFVKDADGKIVSLANLGSRIQSAYYYVNGSAWRNTLSRATIKDKVSALGFKEGDKFTVGVAAVPEYYTKGADLSDDELKSLLESGKLGDGAILSNTFTVDDTAPEAVTIYKDLTKEGLYIEAKDNQYIAYAAVMDKFGMNKLADIKLDQKEAGETLKAYVDLTGVHVGPVCTLLLADYAGNETYYSINYGGEPEDYTGKMYGFTQTEYRGSGARCVNIDPAELYYNDDSDCGGVSDMCFMDTPITAADYVKGTVFMAGEDGILYAAAQGEWPYGQKVCDFSDVTSLVTGMAYSYSDDKLYAMGEDNTVYSIDMLSGEFTKECEISIINPKSDYADTLHTLAVDDKGNFYSTNDQYYSYTQVFLYHWTKDDMANGKIEDLAPVVNDVNNYAGGYADEYGQSLAWDHDKDILYWANSTSWFGTGASISIFDLTTGKSTPVPSKYEDPELALDVSGLYVVPKGNGETIGTSDTAIKVELNKNEMSLLTKSQFKLTADVYPWNLEDKSIAWSSDNKAVASVDENGLVTAVAPGKAVITATTNAEPHIAATCSVTVEDLVTDEIKGLVYDVDGKTFWSKFNPTELPAWEKGTESSGKYYSGYLHEGKLYEHDGKTTYSVDPDTFEATSLGSIASSWTWSDMATAPKVEHEDYTAFGAGVGACYGGQFLEILYPEEGNLKYFDLSSYFYDDPMAMVAYIGSDSDETKDYAYYYVLTEGGNLYTFKIYTANGSSYSLSFEYTSKVGLNLSGLSSADGSSYGCMILEQKSQRLILSMYNDGELNEVYVIDPGTGIAADLGNFGDKVWPVVSLYQNESAQEGAGNAGMISAASEMVSKDIISQDAKVTDVVSPEETKNTGKAKGSLNSASIESSSMVDEDEKTVTVEVTAKDKDGKEAASTNGLINVDYDKDALELKSVNVHADYKAVNKKDGSVKFSYAQTEEIAAGQSVATLTFAVKNDDDTVVKVTTEQLNNDKPGYIEEVAVKFADKTTVLEKVYGNTRYSTAAAISQHGWVSSDYAVLASGKAYVDALVSAPLAAVYNAPVLITDTDELSKETSKELDRLGVKTVFIAGGTGVVSEKVQQELTDMNIAVMRFNGADRYETSLMIAKYIDKVTNGGVNKAYVVGGLAEADAVSIASKAANEKQPIILSGKDKVDDDTISWLKAKKLSTAYVIGGEGVVSNAVLDSLNKVTAEDISGNRVWGADRYATNAAVLKAFYVKGAEEYEAEKVFVTKGDPVIDTLVAAPFAAQTDSPIVIVGKELTDEQREVLANVASLHLIQVGGDVSEAAVSEMIKLLSR